jgi:hypothetical protein
LSRHVILFTITLIWLAGAGPLDRVVTAEPLTKSAASVALSREQDERAIVRLARQLANSSSNSSADSAALGTAIADLREALNSYVVTIDGVARLENSKTTTVETAVRPVAPKRLESPTGSPQGTADPRAREESLRGTHLAPSPQEMRKRVEDTVEVKRQAASQILDLLLVLDSALPNTSGREEIDRLAQRIVSLSLELAAKR